MYYLSGFSPFLTSGIMENGNVYFMEFDSDNRNAHLQLMAFDIAKPH